MQAVAIGTAKRFGEAIGADTGTGLVVGATDFGSGAKVALWTKAAGSSTWDEGRDLVPTGFVSSYDSAIAEGSNHTALVVAGASTSPLAGCLNGGSVFLVPVDPATGTERTLVLVDDERGKSAFDDRPAVAAASGGRVWAAWSHGPAADCAQVVGAQDVIQVAMSTDGGATFGPSATLPRATTGAAFGVSIVPLGGSAFLVWTEVTPSGGLAVVGDQVSASGSAGPVRVIATGTALPPESPVLPAASFYEFAVARATLLGDGDVAVAWPVLQGGTEMLAVATGTPGGPVWPSTRVVAPAGQDLLLGAVAATGKDTALLVYGQHARTGDAVGYQWAMIDASGAGAPVIGVPQTLLPPEPGPGFFEIGEMTSLLGSPEGVVAAAVAGSSSASKVEVAEWPVGAAEPPPVSPSASPSPSPLATPVAIGTGGSSSRHSGGSGWSGDRWLLVGGAVIVVLVVGIVARRRAVVRRRQARRRLAQVEPTDLVPPSRGIVVGPMEPGDIEDAVALHREALGAEFLTGLGTPFLRRYYRAWVASPSGLALIAVTPAAPDGEALAGLLLGSLDPAAHYRFIVRHHGASLALALLGCTVGHPSVGAKLIRTRGARYARGLLAMIEGRLRRSRPASPSLLEAAPERVGEVTHVAVSAARRRGGVGRELLSAADEAFRSAGVDRLDLVTPSSDDGAQAFYRSLGWAATEEAISKSGERFVRFSKSLGEAVEPLA